MIVEYIDIEYQTIYTDRNFCRCLQYGTVCQKIINSLRALNNFLPPKTKVMLVQILIFPINDYGDFQLNADLLNKLNHFINNCIRFIFNLYKYDHMFQYRSQLKWLVIRQRREIRALTTLYT